MNIFETVKQAVTTKEAALFYGIQVNRNGMACCPFHHDHTPSMKLDNRFHCFACQADGDVVDFVAMLHGLSVRDAALQLLIDFGISYARYHPPNANRKKLKPTEQELLQAEQKHFEEVLQSYLSLLRLWEKEHCPTSPDALLNDRFVEAIQEKERIIYLLEVLFECTDETRKDLLLEIGEEVRFIEQRVSDSRGDSGKPNYRERQESTKCSE